MSTAFGFVEEVVSSRELRSQTFLFPQPRLFLEACPCLDERCKEHGERMLCHGLADFSAAVRPWCLR